MSKSVELKWLQKQEGNDWIKSILSVMHCIGHSKRLIYVDWESVM